MGVPGKGMSVFTSTRSGRCVRIQSRVRSRLARSSPGRPRMNDALNLTPNAFDQARIGQRAQILKAALLGDNVGAQEAAPNETVLLYQFGERQGARLIEREDVVVEHETGVPAFGNFSKLTFNERQRFIPDKTIPNDSVPARFAERARHRTTATGKKGSRAVRMTGSVSKRRLIFFIPSPDGRKRPIQRPRRNGRRNGERRRAPRRPTLRYDLADGLWMIALARNNHVKAQLSTHLRISPGRGPAEDDCAFLPPSRESGQPPDFVHLRTGGREPDLVKLAVVRERVTGQIAEVG